MKTRSIAAHVFPASERARCRCPLDEFSVVSIGTCYREPSLPFAVADQYLCSRLAVLELWKLGYRRIGYVALPMSELASTNRFSAGYLATLAVAYGTTPLPPFVSADENEITDWLWRHQPDAVIAANPLVETVLRGMGWRAPERIGFAFMNVARDDPHTSGVCQNLDQVGASAVDLLIDQWSGHEQCVPSSTSVAAQRCPMQ